MSVFPTLPDDTATAFVEQSRAWLRDEYVPKILACLKLLGDEDIWWRPNPASNSVGNLVLHLCGNARQWIVSCVLGGPDIRVRSAEFDADGSVDRELLADLLRAAMREVDEALASLEPSSLGEWRSVQGFNMTVLQAVYHVVEHFSGHAGQISYITKMRTGRDLNFYQIGSDGSVITNW